MRFVFDANLGYALAGGMDLLDDEAEVRHITDSCPKGTPDDVWMRTVGDKGWILVSRDKALIKNPTERKSYQIFRVGGFWLESAKNKNLSAFEIVEQVVRNWRRMKEWAEKTKPPYLLRVPAFGTPSSFEDLLTKR